MEVGDAAAWFAAAIAGLAALIALGNANSAKRQAQAAEQAVTEAKKQTKLAVEANESARRSMEATEKSAASAGASADAAREANRLTLAQHDRDQAERDTAAIAEASKVVLELTGGGGLWVNIENHARETFFTLVLEQVVSDDQPTWGWQLNPKVMGKRSAYETLEPQQKRSFPVVFTDDEDVTQRYAGTSFDVTFSYSDSTGQRWRRTNSRTPERVDSSNMISTGEQARNPSDREIERQLVALMIGLKDRGSPLAIGDFPQELGVDDTTVQRCLRNLMEAGHIKALTGDDRVLSVHDVTAMGRQAAEQHDL